MSLFFLPPASGYKAAFPGGALLPLALALLLAGGCASGGATEAGSSGASPAGASGSSAAAEAESPFPQVADLEALLSEWADHLEEESSDEVNGVYRAFTRSRSAGEAPEQLLWTMAMIHLMPESPLQDRARGLEHLATLEKEFPDALEGIQAGLLRQLFRDMDRTAADAEEGERLVAELTQTVAQFKEAMEQLKRIDLNRRPVREIRGDTLPGRIDPERRF